MVLEYYENLQDHLAHIQVARQAINSLREDFENQRMERLREEQNLRRIQVQKKLELMRQKKNVIFLLYPLENKIIFCNLFTLIVISLTANNILLTFFKDMLLDQRNEKFRQFQQQQQLFQKQAHNQQVSSMNQFVPQHQQGAYLNPQQLAQQSSSGGYTWPQTQQSNEFLQQNLSGHDLGPQLHSQHNLSQDLQSQQQQHNFSLQELQPTMPHTPLQPQNVIQQFQQQPLQMMQPQSQLHQQHYQHPQTMPQQQAQYDPYFIGQLPVYNNYQPQPVQHSYSSQQQLNVQPQNEPPKQEEVLLISFD